MGNIKTIKIIEKTNKENPNLYVLLYNKDFKYMFI